MTKSVDNAILDNLNKLKPQKEDKNEEEIKPDDLIKDLGKFSNQPSHFDFESKRSYFDEVYFKNSKLFKIGSKEHADFWTFLKKYQSLMKRKAPHTSSQTDPLTTDYSQRFHHPLNYNKRWRLNFVYKPSKSNFSMYDWQGNSLKTKATEEQLSEFEMIIHYFLDFRQKEKVNLYFLLQLLFNYLIFRFWSFLSFKSLKNFEKIKLIFQSSNIDKQY